MKKILLLLTFLSIASDMFAQVSKTLNLVTAGTLSTSLTSNELTTITNLTLTGTIDARDFKTMKDNMPLLAILDLSGIKVEAYSGTEGPSWNTNYPANAVPENAFALNRSLTTIVLASSLSSIGQGAFYGCSALTTITIPSSVTSIGDHAFGECSGLSTFTIPSSVTSIGNLAFFRCDGLTTITIPSSVTSIGEMVFERCSGLLSITVDANNPEYSSLDGVLYNKNQTTLIYCPNAKIGKLTIPSSVTSIGHDAFSECSGLTTVVMPSAVTSIGDHAFYLCRGLTTITIPSSVTSIGEYAFVGCSGLTTLTIPSSVTSIGKGAFYSCIFLTTVTIPSSVTSIGNTAFNDCTRLTSIITSMPTPLNFGPFGAVFFKVNKTTCTLYVPVGSKSAYQAADPWKDFTNIVEKDFTGIDPMISINVTSAGTLSTLFVSNDRYNITKLKITGTMDARDFKTMRDNMPLLSELDLSGVTIAAYNGTEGTTSEKTDYPANVIPYYAFINPDTRQGKTSLISVVLPSSVISIGYNAFSGCSELTSVTIPSSVTTIGDAAFSDCSRLTSVTIPSSVTSIGELAFGFCSGLTSFTIPSSLTSIENSAFYLCSGLTSVTIPSSVTSIGDWAFYKCSGLTTVVIPSLVTSIRASAFESCRGLTSITSSRITPLDLSSNENVFKDVNKTTCILYVPTGSKIAYQAADKWKDFANIVEKDFTGIDPMISDQQLTVYPNPTTGKVKIVFAKIPQKGATMTVNDFTGKTILTQLIQNKEEQIDLSGNSPGVYLIRTNSKDFKVQKVILK